MNTDRGLFLETNEPLNLNPLPEETKERMIDDHSKEHPDPKDLSEMLESVGLGGDLVPYLDNKEESLGISTFQQQNTN
eukprot:CAMPEP_0205830486 /NCGR_PEP_ID=MMETSP0206-20130828/41170_1 /ASSEMBLY_ACC=CAM_ASM_000279 /TAXON_ID=36767 /ORGANISM="Euplotes focardii, Strain TN1" /LENGTH=77 /DNA_ID=CAMNT_0053134173 /DNA_START=682 /DNA_END=915 /DNA_ORIENTATION=+